MMRSFLVLVNTKICSIFWVFHRCLQPISGFSTVFTGKKVKYCENMKFLKNPLNGEKEARKGNQTQPNDTIKRHDQTQPNVTQLNLTQSKH